MSQTETPRLGASHLEWQWAAYHCGPDLLPAYLGTVDSPSTERLQDIAAKARAKGIAYPWAKTPSRLGSTGVAAGFGKWTSFQATQQDVDQWTLEPDYNVLIQTRSVRGIDIDIDDKDIADKLEAMICGAFGVALPVRYRANSGKRTLLFRIEPNEFISKRVVHTSIGAIELLANGNQTAWFGCHTSGVRFQHRNLEVGVPTVPLATAVALWDALRNAYDPKATPLIIEGEKQGEFLARLAGQSKQDPVLEYLAEEGWVIGYENNGTANVRCPNESAHSEGGGNNATSWLPAGLGGKEYGGFRCLHAHCAHINTPKFLELVGFREKEVNESFGGATLQQHPIAVAQQTIAAAVAAIPAGKEMAERDTVATLIKVGRQLLSALPITKSKEKAAKTINNLVALLDYGHGFLDAQYDEFKDQVSVRMLDQDSWKPLTDNVVGSVRLAVEAVLGHNYSHEEISRHISLVAEYNKIDSAKEWIAQQTWDGVERVDAFALNILRAAPSEYATALSRYLFVAMAGRVLSPGCKADIAPVLLSPRQGTGKSSLVEALAPLYPWFGQVDLTTEDADVYRAIKGKVVIELPELRGLIGRDAQATKALLTQQVDRWIPKYREHEIEVPRRCVFIGTDNRKRFLADPTGNRRWAPIHVAQTSEFIDWPTYEQERDQYWAEAKHLIAQHASPAKAVEFYSSKLRNLAGPAIADATILDAWHGAVDGFMRQQQPGTRITLTSIFSHLFGSSLGTMDYGRVNRLRSIMTVLKADEVAPDTWLVPKAEYVL